LKVSIITVCFNSSATIRDTLASVQRQNYADYEHLIIDGGSQDNTLSIVAEFERPELRVFSGPDKGIYDAMNKGVMHAKGDIIGFLNSDDFYASDDVVAKIESSFRDSACDILYGDIFYVDPNDTSKVSRFWKSKSFHQSPTSWLLCARRNVQKDWVVQSELSDSSRL
jgi:glycosyltransferase involved in cell wall biosynthesis